MPEFARRPRTEIEVVVGRKGMIVTTPREVQPVSDRVKITVELVGDRLAITLVDLGGTPMRTILEPRMATSR